ncbi:MAG: cytidine deaminase [Acidobacteriota bacterium]|nr:cytidine deaminase [Acidobacteriota bacterium]MDT5062775.1 cytidine deaminase [Acidobacteriota bacterium]
MNEVDKEAVIVAALAACDLSVAPFSNFLVGAAVQTQAGKIFTGCNIESASYGLTVCAERVAIWKAVSEGERNFTHLVIAADTQSLTPPCGTCRQIIWEFAKNAEIILVNRRGDHDVVQIRDLLPLAFDARFLKEAMRSRT